MMNEEQKNLNVIKWTNKREKLRKLMFYYLNFLEDDLMWYGVENIYNVYLKHHPIKMGIQSGLNTMDRDFITFFNHHPKLIWWQVKNKCIMKLQA
jgi:hypothetical protein